MTTYDMTDFAAQVDGVLRPLGITRNMRAYHTLSEALRLICEQEDRLEAVQKEIYEPLADRHCCDWTAIQSMIRRAAQTSWATNPAQVQHLAGYPLTGCPSARRCAPNASLMATERCAPPVQPMAIISRRLPSR